MCLMRFISRRGTPLKIHSDRGTNFVGCDAELTRSVRQLDNDKITTFARRQDIEWGFHPPHASNFSGVWERLILCVRRVLTALLVSSPRMNEEVLHTVFCQVESVVNSRPITKVSVDVDDDCALTPNHLLLIKGNMPYPWTDDRLGDTYRKHWKHVHHIVSQFWKRWLKSYLPELQRRRKWLKLERNVRKGDLVLMSDQNTPRGSWPLGLVTDVKEGRDGLVRSATIKTKTSVLVRPINKLVLIEGSD